MLYVIYIYISFVGNFLPYPLTLVLNYFITFTLSTFCQNKIDVLILFILLWTYHIV